MRKRAIKFLYINFYRAVLSLPAITNGWQVTQVNAANNTLCQY